MGPRTAAFTLALAVAVPAGAQLPPLTLPQASPAASVRQVLGVTEHTMNNHRASVNDRAVWGALVPYDQVWRAGANENTVISFSTPVKIGGTELAAGRYGLHMIPSAGDWTVILSRMADAWGSFTYDASEDALRFSARPESAPFQDRLGYSFDEVTANSAVLALRWEKLRLPIPLAVDTTAVVLADLRRQLRGLPRFGWQAWNQAANWSRQNGGDLAEAEAWIDHSLTIQRNFTNLSTKSRIAAARGRAAEGEQLMTEAMAIATEAEVNQLGYQHLGAGEVDRAIAVFRKNVADHPDSWNAYDSLGEGLAVKGDKAEAIRNYEKALSMVTDEVQKTRIRGALATLRGN